MNKSIKISDFVLEEIRSGRIKPGDVVSSRARLMAQFSCARATVDAAISSLVVQGVLTGTKGSGTYVADFKKKSGFDHIVIISSELSSQAMPKEIVYSFMAQMPNNNKLEFLTYDEVRYPARWAECKQQRAIIFVMPDIQNGNLLHDVQSNGIPHLVLYRDIPESSFVSIDNTAAVAKLVRALREKGCARIAYFGSPHSRYFFPDRRYIGYLEGLVAADLVFDKRLAWFIPTNQEHLFFDQFFSLNPFPDALIVDNRPLGPIIGKLQAKGLRIGDGFTLACFDPVILGTYPFPVISLGSVTSEVGRLAVSALEQILDDPKKIVQQYVQPNVIS